MGLFSPFLYVLIIEALSVADAFIAEHANQKDTTKRGTDDKEPSPSVRKRLTPSDEGKKSSPPKKGEEKTLKTGKDGGETSSSVRKRQAPATTCGEEGKKSSLPKDEQIG